MADFAKMMERMARLPWRPLGITVAAGFLVASLLSTLMAHFLFGKDETQPRSSGRVAKTEANFKIPDSSATLSQSGLDTILRRNIFNSEGSALEEVERPEKERDPGKAVETQLPLTLQGTIYGGDPYSGIAMVENTSKRTVNSFMVGDTLMQGAVVEEILREKIIIDNQGQREFLKIEKEELVRRQRRSAGSSSSGSSGPAPIATKPPPETYSEEGFERQDTDINMTESFKNKLLTEDFTKVLQDAKATPKMVDGELDGFELTRIRQDSIYEKAGLQNGDVVKEINGIPLTDTSQAIRLLNSLRDESQIDVRITRNGSPVRFSVNVQ